jgi:glycosyltransferase involved in cell wall biosynthesis
MALTRPVGNPLRILAVGNMYPPHHAGGYEVMWQTAMARARELGHDVRVVTSDFRTPGVGVETDPDVHRTLRWYWDLDRYEFPQLSPIDRVRLERHNARELGRHLDEFRPDVVSWWSMGAMSLSLIERVHRRGTPAVFIVHDDWLVYAPGFDQWLRMWRGRRLLLAPLAERLLGLPTSVGFDRAGRFVFNSRYTRDTAGRTGLDVADARVIYPGIGAELRIDLPSQAWGWRLLYIGRIDGQKGIDTAVEALAQLPAQATLEVWGTGNQDYSAQMRSLAGHLGLEHRVSFRGWAGPAERLAAYERADVVVFPVRWEEPFGLVPIEAMGVGRPVVSTARGGSTEFLRDRENALVFEAGDAAGLAAAVTRLASDPELREHLLDGGRRTAAEHTIERFAAQTVQAILGAADDEQP